MKLIVFIFCMLSGASIAQTHPVELIKNSGFFLENFIGYSDVNRIRAYALDPNLDDWPGAALGFETVSYRGTHIGTQAGHRFYFSEKRNPTGLKVIWMRFGANISKSSYNNEDVFLSFDFAPLNVGITQLFRLKNPYHRIECSLEGGAALITAAGYQQKAIPSASFGATINYLIGRFAIGLNFNRVTGKRKVNGNDYGDSRSTSSISIGFRL